MCFPPQLDSLRLKPFKLPVFIIFFSSEHAFSSFSTHFHPKSFQIHFHQPSHTCTFPSITRRFAYLKRERPTERHAKAGLTSTVADIYEHGGLHQKVQLCFQIKSSHEGGIDATSLRRQKGGGSRPLLLPQRLDELDGGLDTEPKCRRRSLRFPQEGGGRAREVG